MMEQWNAGIMVFQRMLSIFDFIANTNVAINPELQYPKTIFPLFQHSIIPIGPNP